MQGKMSVQDKRATGLVMVVLALVIARRGYDSKL